MSRRGQANLAALAVAVVLVTTAAGVGLALATAAGDTEGAESARERRLAASAARHLVASDSPLTARRGVVDTERVGSLDADALPGAVAESNASVAVAVGGETAFERGDSEGGTAVRRLVLAGASEAVTRRAGPGQSNVTVRPGTSFVTVTAEPAANATVTTLRVDGRVRRYDPEGVEGPQTLAVDATTATTVRVETATNGTATTTVRYRLLRGDPTTLEVRVDA